MDNPEVSPVDEDLLKKHLAIDQPELFELVSDLYLPAAVQEAEDSMRRSIMTRQHRWVLNGFPCGEITLPRGLATAVTSIEYSYNGGTSVLSGPTSTAPGTDFQEDLSSDRGGRLLPARNSSWPSYDCEALSPVVINFAAGWLTPDAVPKNIVHAIIFAVGDLLEFRHTGDYAVLQSAIASGRTADARDNLLGGWKLREVIHG
jgi:hypothetical protein